MKITNIPLTQDEVLDVQTTVVTRILELNRKLDNATGLEAKITSNEILKLSSIVHKVSKHTTVDTND